MDLSTSNNNNNNNSDNDERMSSFSACEISNHGVIHMARGRHAEASACFKKAIQALRELVHLHGPPSNNAILLHQVALDQFLQDSNSGRVSPDGGFEVYDAAFTLHFDELRPFDQGLAVGTVVYNMALNAHVASLRFSKAHHLLTARRLYALAEQMLRGNNDQTPASVNVSLLLLARCNNECHCRSAVFDRVGMEACREHLFYTFDNTAANTLPDKARVFFQFACSMGKSIACAGRHPAPAA
jgi:hypothetical protein